MTADATKSGLYLPCASPSCGQPVHKQSKTCKLCGAASPWLGAQAEAQRQAAFDEPTPAPATEGFTRPVESETQKMSSGVKPVAEIVSLPQPVFEPHVVLKDFNFLFGDVFGAFKQGQVLNDFQTITRLKAAGQPIAPASEVDNLVSCPCCSHMFLIPERAKRKAG